MSPSRPGRVDGLLFPIWWEKKLESLGREDMDFLYGESVHGHESGSRGPVWKLLE